MWFFISTFILFLPIIYTEKNGVTIDLVRHKSPREIGLNIKSFKEYSANWLLKPNNSTNDTVALYRYLDNEFYAVIQIGKKARPFNLALDTAWGHMWVMSADCPYRTVGCWFHNKYDHTHSSTYQENGTDVTIKTGKYNLTGYYSQDVVYLEKLNVTNQTFIEMTDIPRYYILSKLDGVLGLGYAQLADGVTPVFYNLIKQKRIKKSLFSIYLNRDRQSSRGGNVIFGRIEKRHILENHTITYVPVNLTGYWQFKMDRIVLEDAKKSFQFCINNCQAVSDTSSNAIYGPPMEIQKINRLIRAKLVMYDRYEVDCETINKLPEISFIIAGKNFTLAGRDYVQQVSYKSFTLCLSAFMPVRDLDPNTWYLGGAFLSEFYSIYDLEHNQIGLVKAA